MRIIHRTRLRTTLVAPLAVLVLAPLATVAPASVGVAPQASPAAAEPSAVVLAWERTLIRTVYVEHETPIPVGVPYLGFTSVAMHDAARAAVRREASATAAVAVAAHDVLAEYFPGSLENLDADLADSLDAVAGSEAKTRGIRTGRRAADRMIAARADDGRDDTSIVYAKPEAPGIWQPEAGVEMLAPWLGFVDLMASPKPIRAGGPDPITSREYAADFLEVKSVGSATGADRTRHQEETAQFFNSNSAIMVGDALLRYLDDHPLGLLRTTRMFAVMHAAMTDAVISTWRLKYNRGYWRPFQAIAGAGSDDNPATLPDAEWEPLIPNPPYSDYVSGHASLTAPAVETVRVMLGEETPLLLQSTSTGTERTYPTLAALEREAAMARIWGGLHFRDAMEDGYAIGHVAARRALDRIRIR